MILERIEVLNYKCLRYIRQRLRPFQILIGPNASGKSTFLDVLVFLQDLLQSGVGEAVRRRARSIRELTWRMQSDEFEIAVEFRIPERIQQKLDEKYSLVRYEVRVGVGEDGTLTLPVENLWLVHEKKRNSNPAESRIRSLPPGTIVQEPRKRTPAGYRKIMGRTADGQKVWIGSEITRWNFHLGIKSDRAGLTMIPEEEERFPVSEWFRRMLMEGVQFLQLNSSAMRWACRPDAPRTFQPDGSNLPIVVEMLGEKHPKQLKRWVQHLRTVLPEIKDVLVKERGEDNHRYLVVETFDGKFLPSWLLSDGTLRLFALTLLAYLPGEKGIYVIEEPENGVHPHALEAVYQSLSSVYEGQVLCATHSPILLNMANLEELLCFSRTEDGATTIVSGDQHPLLKHWQEKTALGDLLASGILG